jgi:uncharacterized protein (UPF0332 family)
VLNPPPLKVDNVAATAINMVVIAIYVSHFSFFSSAIFLSSNKKFENHAKIIKVFWIQNSEEGSANFNIHTRGVKYEA